MERVEKDYNVVAMSKRSFSAFLGIIDFDGLKFALFCDEAIVASAVDGIEIFEISSLFFLSYLDYRELKHRPYRKEIYHKIREYYVILKTGFYFSYMYGLTHTLKNQSPKKYSQIFTWNRKLLYELDKAGVNANWKLPIIQGFVRTFYVFLEGTKLSYVLISRRSNQKGGTRYFDRGMDEDGFVANYVYTEQIIKLDDYLISDVQIRGSVPLFFEQVGLTTKVRLIRGDELTHEVYKKHMKKLIDYHYRVFFVNLLAMGKGGYKILIYALYTHLKSYLDPNIKYLHYDFHKKVSGGHYERVDEVINDLRIMKINLRYYIYDSKQHKVLYEAHGVFRTNCLDCLDRTNFFQAKLALITLEAVLKQFDVCDRNLLEDMRSNDYRNYFIRKFRSTWADNGDSISYHYTGTGSTHTDITRDGKRGWMGNIKHKYKSVTRFYNQNFWDFYKMRLVYLLLGRRNKNKPEIVEGVGNASYRLAKYMKDRENEYIKKSKARVYIFTWKAPKKPPRSLYLLPNDIYLIAVSIQYVNDQYTWRNLIMYAIDNNKYILVNEKISNSNILMVYSLRELKGRISYVYSTSVKFKSYYNSLLSKKCAVLIRFSFDQTKLVFCGCQLEYGRYFAANRYRNLRYIHEYAFQEYQVGQQKSLPILADYVIFLIGNMNTNVSASFHNEFSKLDPARIRSETDNVLLKRMLETDEFYQLQQSLMYFREYDYGTIGFLPTYKWINGMYDADKSGWTDRIWYSAENSNVVCWEYRVIESLRSYHVPVVGLFEVEVEKVDQQLREKICVEVIEKDRTVKSLVGKDGDEEDYVDLGHYQL